MPRRYLSKARDIILVALLAILVSDLILSPAEYNILDNPAVLILVTIAGAAALVIHIRLDKRK
jgi:hypothetical protein